MKALLQLQVMANLHPTHKFICPIQVEGIGRVSSPNPSSLVIQAQVCNFVTLKVTSASLLSTFNSVNCCWRSRDIIMMVHQLTVIIWNGMNKFYPKEQIAVAIVEAV